MTDRPSFRAGLDTGLADPPGATPGAGLAWVRTRARPALACGSAVAVLAVAASFAVPPTYVAQVTVLEAPRPGGGSALDQLGLGAEALGLKVGGASSNALTYPDILRSRRLLGRLLDERVPTRGGASVRYLNLVQPGTDGPARIERALRRLRKRVDASLDRRTNMLTVRVSERDPVVAAAAANAACTILQDIVLNGMTTQSGATRRFVERQLARAREDLAASESRLRAFHERNLRIGNSPRLLVEQGRLMRVVAEREAVVGALARQYEIARVEEGRDVPVLNVLDPAVPPPFRSAPRRAPFAAGGLLLGVAAGLVLGRVRRVPAAAEPLERAA
jgi:uncharacterized protein involved in exopolysaccharide biosynthesis